MTADDYVRSPLYHDRTKMVPVVAAGPIVREPGTLPHRVVIRCLLTEFVVHTEVFREVGCEPGAPPSHYYFHGDYFPKRSTPDEAMRLAWTAFADRNGRAVTMLAEAEKVRRENAALVH